jgi:RND family efflux transporter MFP subunit
MRWTIRRLGRVPQRRVIEGLLSVAVLVVLQGAIEAMPLDCLVVPQRTADVAFGTSGVVEEILVDRGDRVKKGDLLGRLDASIEAANLAIARERLSEVATLQSARAQLRTTKIKFQRNEALRDKEIVAAAKFEEAELENEIARIRVVEQEEAQQLKQLEVRRADAALALRSMRSPFEGVVVERHVAPGEYVENRRAITVAQIDPVYADVIAPAAMFSRFKKGQKIKVTLSQPNAIEVVGEVSVIDPYVDGASETFRVRIAIANPNYSVVPGFRCVAQVATESQ